MNGPKLTQGKALEIRQLYFDHGQDIHAIAERYGVSYKHTLQILRNTRWPTPQPYRGSNPFFTPPPLPATLKKFTLLEVQQIRRLRSKHGWSYKRLGKEYDAHFTTISKICRYITYRPKTERRVPSEYRRGKRRNRGPNKPKEVAA